MAETAAELRARLQARRKSMDPREHEHFQKLLDIRFFTYLREVIRPRPGQCWGVHRALPWEWSLPLSLQYLRESGIALAYPRMCDPADRSAGMNWHLADESLSADWVRCASMKSLLEPRHDLPEIDPGRMAGVWVPGVAFSERGERMGTGGGFYDTFLALHPKLFRVAVAAEFQIFAILPGQRPDEPRMSAIVGQKKVLSFSGGN